MKNKKNIKNWWNGLPLYAKESIIYWTASMALITAVMVALISVGVIPLECGNVDEKNTKQSCATQKNAIALPERTNAGDTLYVLGRDGCKLRAVDGRGNVVTHNLKHENYVASGDTIIVHSKSGMLMKNITQNRMMRKWQKQK